MNFTGRWVGETQGITMPLHSWVIVQYGNLLNFYTRWEDEPQLHIYGKGIRLHENTFTFHTPDGDSFGTPIELSDLRRVYK